MINTNDLIKNNELYIDKELWISLNKKYTKDTIKQAISDAISNHGIQLPYRKITKDEARDDFVKLKGFDSKSLLFDGKFDTRYEYKYNFLNKYINISTIGNKSSDYFQQENRFMCDSINAPSPYRTWNSERFRLTLLNALWTLKVEKVTMDGMRTLISLRKYIASQFKPSVAKFIYERFKSEKILDFSGGWGDRLAGFYSSNESKEYTVVDPNSKVTEAYSKQIKFYENCGVSGKKVNIYNCGAEEIDDYKNEFDLVFTSPPYFDIERYTNEGNQSWKKYKKLQSWLDDFLFKSIKTGWNSIASGGHLVINISDVYCHHKIQNICDPMNDYIKSFPDSKYLGALGMRMAKRPNSKALINKDTVAEPIWIWEKR